MSDPMDTINDGKPFSSRAEMVAALRDSRYAISPAYEARVKARIAVTDFSETAGVSINQSLVPDGEGLADIDQINPAMPWGYQSVHDFKKLFRDPQYKVNPAYRLAVEGAVREASPDWQPRTTDEYQRVQYRGKDTGAYADGEGSVFVGEGEEGEAK